MWFKQIISFALALQIIILPVLAERSIAQTTSAPDANLEQRYQGSIDHLNALKAQGWEFTDLQNKPITVTDLVFRGQTAFYIAPTAQGLNAAESAAIKRVMIKVISRVNENGAVVYLNAYDRQDLKNSIADTKISIVSSKSDIENRTDMDRSMQIFSDHIGSSLSKKFGLNQKTHSPLYARLMNLVIPQAHAYNGFQNVLGTIAVLSFGIALLAGFVFFVVKRWAGPMTIQKIKRTILVSVCLGVIVGIVFDITTWIRGPFGSAEDK